MIEVRNLARRSSILLGERHTSVFSRLTAKVIDSLVVVAIFFLGVRLFPPLGLVCAVIFCAMQDGLGSGQSIGKRIMGLRVIEDINGTPCNFWNSFLRNVPFTVAVAFVAVPALWVFFILLTLPVIALELYLLVMVESGVRLGDVLGNTLVVEYLDDAFDLPESKLL